MHLFTLILCLLLSGCNLAPHYHVPPTATPTEWKAETNECADVPPVDFWWEVFEEPLLNELEARALEYNNNLYVAFEKVIEARAIAGIREADLYPQVNLQPSYSNKGILNKIYLPPGTTIPFLSGIEPFRIHQLQYTLPLNLSYELDLWGKLRNQYCFALLSAEAQYDAFYASMLTLTAEVASAYFQIRTLEAQEDLLLSTLASYKKEMEITQSRFNKGLVNLTDVTNAQLEYETVEADYYDTIRLRTLQENRLAVLIGELPSCFRLEKDPLNDPPPVIPPGLPADILMRRPDIAEAERRTAAENSSVGVAKASFFPSLTLTGTLGYFSPTLEDFLTWKSRLWAIGGNINQTVFDGGRNCANLEAAWARFREASGNYQQVVLTAFQEVEDALNNVDNQAKQYDSLDRASEAALKTTRLSRERYLKGITNYLEVVFNEKNELNARIHRIQVLGLRYQSTIQLIKALGGGWESDEPCDEEDNFSSF